MKLYRPWQYLFICSSSRSQNVIVTITLDSDMTGDFKTLHMMFQNGNGVWLFAIMKD